MREIKNNKINNIDNLLKKLEARENFGCHIDFCKKH